MSRTIDQKVVEMKFDNKQFEEAVAQSRQSIKLMEKDINLLEGTKALKNLDKAISNVDFSHMSKSIDGIKNSFSILGTIGRSVVNKLTTDTMNKFQQMAQKASGAVKNIFNQVYQRGYARASKLENSAFQIKGLIERSGLEGEKAEKVTTRIKDMVSEAVTDTAFGLDQASLAASTLASTFGTDEKALKRINKALHAISGVAGTTGAAYEQVADIFTDAAGKGHAMGDEFSRLSLLGINGAEEVAKFVNNTKNPLSIAYRKQLNKDLKKGVNHLITAEEILSLASKKKISAELFSDAFESFFSTAKEANETLNGVTANIGAAMGRLGALFIQPLIQNSGPLVKFLQVVKNGISQIAKTLNDLKIPEKITNFINNSIGVATIHVQNFVEAFEKGKTPLNDFLNTVTKIIDVLSEILQLDPNSPYLGLSGDELKENMEIDKLNKYFKDASKELGKNYKSYKQIEKETLAVFKNSTGISKTQQKKIAMATYLGQMNDDNVHSLKQYESLTREWYKQQLLKDHSKKEVEKLMKDSETKDFIHAMAIEKYNKATEEQTKKIRELAAAETELELEEAEIWNHDYLGDVFGGLKNILGAVIDVFKTLGEAIFGTSGPLKDFAEVVNGEADPKEARKSLNKFTESFKNATEKVREFVNTDGFKKFVSTLGKIIATAVKIIGGIAKIASHVFDAVSPIIIKISDLLGGVFKTAEEGEEGLSVWDRIINGICSAIDFLGQVLLNVWEIGEDVVGWLSEKGVFDVIGAIGQKILEFAKIAIENWPNAWAKIKEAMKGFGDKAKEVFGWIGDKLGPIFDKIKPYLDDFKDKVKDLTNGFIDLDSPLGFIKDLFGGTSDEASNAKDAITEVSNALDKVGNTADKVSGALDNAKTGFASFSGIGGKGQIGIKKDLISMVGVSDIPTEESSSFIDKLKSFNLSKSDAKEAKEKGNILTDILNWFKDFFANTPWDKIGLALTGMLAAFGHYKIGTGIYNISIGIKNLGKNIDSSIANITGFDAKTERLKAMKDVLKTIAAILVIFIVGVWAVTGAIYVLGKMDVDVLLRGLGATLLIMAVMGVFIGAVAYMAKALRGGSSTGEDYMFKNGLSFGKLSIGRSTSGSSVTENDAFKPLVGLAAVLGVFVVGVLLVTAAIVVLGKIKLGTLIQGGIAFIAISAVMVGLLVITFKMLKDIMKPKNGKAMTNEQAKALSTSLIAVAAIIYVFAHSVIKIATAIKLLSLIPTGAGFWQAIGTFVVVGGFMIGLIAVIFIFLRKLLNETEENKIASGSKIKELTKVLAVVALIIFVIGQATGSILKKVVLVATAANIGRMGPAIAALVVTMGIMLSMVAIIMLFTTEMVRNAASQKGLGPQTVKSVTWVLGAIAVIIFVIGQAAGSILRNVALLATTFSVMSPDAITKALVAVGIVLGIILVTVAVILAGVILLTKFASADQIKKVNVTLGLVAAIIFIMAVAIAAIGYAGSQLKDVDPAAITALNWGILALGGIIAVIAIIMVIAGALKVDTKPMYAIVAMMGVLALVFGSLALLAVALGTVEDLEGMSKALMWMGIILGGLIVIMTILAVLGEKQIIGTKGLIAVGVLVGILAALLLALGAAALMIGKSVDLITKGINRLLKTLKSLGKDKEANQVLKDGAKQFGALFSDIIEGVADGVIEAGQKLEEKREPLKEAIKSIFGIIEDAISTSIQQTFLLILNRLSDVVNALDPWLKENGKTIESVLIQIGDILYDVIKHFIDRLTVDIPIWLGLLCDTIEQKAPGLGEKLVSAGIAIIKGLVDGLVNHREEIIECVWNIIKELVNIIFRFFGLEAPFPIVWKAEPKFEEDASSEKADLDASGEAALNQIEDGAAGVEKDVTKYFTDFIGRLGDSILDAVLNNEDLKTAGKALAYSLTGEGDPFDVAQQQVDANTNYRKARSAFKTLYDYYRKQDYTIENAIKKAKEDMAREASKIGAGKFLTEDVYNEFITYWKIKSPSKRAQKAAAYVAQGFAKGFSDPLPAKTFKNLTEDLNNIYIEGMEDSGKMAVTGLTQDLKTAIPKIKNVLMNSGLFSNDAFVIKPDVDLSTVEGRTEAIQGMFDKLGIGVNVDSAVDMFGQLKSGNFSSIDINKVVTGFDSANGITSSAPIQDASSANIVFNQNNYSPESLSQIDIYRNTESLLSNNSTINGVLNAVGVKSSNINLSYISKIGS